MIWEGICSSYIFE